MIVPPLKIVFAGTPDFAAAHLQALIDSDHHICAVYTQPDRPAGRGRKLTPSPVKQLAAEQHLTICQPETLKTADAGQILRSFAADLMVVVAYGIILPAEILAIPRLGCINVHGSLLPRWRGAAPIQRAIEAGDFETGVSIMQMDEGLDTGAVLLTSRIAISDYDTSGSLYSRLMRIGSESLLTAVDKIAAGTISAIEQDDSKACYAKKLTTKEAAINWSLSAEQLLRKIRAFDPWPGNSVNLNDQRIKIIAGAYISNQTDKTLGQQIQPGTIISANKNGLRVACGKGSLLIKSLQLPGKKMTPVAEILNAYSEKFQSGQQFN